MPNKLTLEEFVDRARVVHGDCYMYDRTVYAGAKVPILITCPVHGDFSLTPDNHLRGRGCPLCVVRASLPVNVILNRFREAHGNRYDYSRMVFRTVKDRVEIICREHGIFWQSPDNHMRGKGCRMCRAHLRESRDIFIEKATLKHGQTYNYSDVIYRDSKSKVCILCPTHGNFMQSPSHHLMGRGCPMCRDEMNSIRSRRSAESFIEKAKEIHPGCYLYGAVKYQGNKRKVQILCPIHGYFWQTPDHHLNGSGCPSCTKNGFNAEKPAELYIYQICNSSGEYAGFGITGSPKSRHLRHSKSFKLSGSRGTLTHTFEFNKGADALCLENTIKDQLNCVDSGVIGFKTEAIKYTDIDDLLTIVSGFMANQ